MRHLGARLAIPGIVLALGLAAAGRADVDIGAEDVYPRRPVEPFRESAHDVLARAFENFYGSDLEERGEFIVQMENGREFRFEADVVWKHIHDTVYQVIHFVGGSDRRDLKMLKITRDDRSDDIFVWLDDLRRVRRITSAQRGDAFQGSDIAIEDLEILRVERFEILGRTTGVTAGEPAHVIAVGALYESSYDRADFFVSQRDYALLEVRLYRAGAAEPFKVTRFPRSEMVRQDGHTLPLHVIFLNHERRTRAEFRFRYLRVNPDLDNALFTKSALESKRRVISPSAGRDEAAPADVAAPR